MWAELGISKPQNNQIITTSINNKNFLITTIDGELFATKDVCPHEGIQLSLGCIKNNQIKCSLHGFSFNPKTGKCDESFVDKLTTYKIKEEKNKLWIQI